MPLIIEIVQKLFVNQNPENQKLIVTYEGTEYEATYTVSEGFVEVKVFIAGMPNFKKAAKNGDGRVTSIARMMALEILRSAKQRGELA